MWCAPCQMRARACKRTHQNFRHKCANDVCAFVVILDELGERLHNPITFIASLSSALWSERLALVFCGRVCVVRGRCGRRGVFRGIPLRDWNPETMIQPSVIVAPSLIENAETFAVLLLLVVPKNMAVSPDCRVPGDPSSLLPSMSMSVFPSVLECLCLRARSIVDLHVHVVNWRFAHKAGCHVWLTPQTSESVNDVVLTSNTTCNRHHFSHSLRRHTVVQKVVQSTSTLYVASNTLLSVFSSVLDE